MVGQLVRGDGKKRLGLRADMDALPIVEANTFGYASKRRGMMHACGHDGHTAMLHAAAKYLASKRSFLRHAEPDIPAGRRGQAVPNG